MKISLAFCWVILALNVNVKIGARPIGQIQGGDLLVLKYDGMGQQNGSIVNITESGLMDVVVGGNEFVVEICTMQCNAEVLVCYDGDTSSLNASGLCGTQCGFYVTGEGNEITVRSSSTTAYEVVTTAFMALGQPKKGACDAITILNEKLMFRDIDFTSCVPKIENGMVKLNITMASAECPIIIKNANVLPETTTIPSTTTKAATFVQASPISAKSGNGTTEEPATFIASYWWIFLIIGLVIIAGIVTGFLIYCLIFKKEKKPTIVSPAVKRHLKRPKTKIVEQPPPEEEEENKRSKLPSSILDPSSILSQKSLLNINKEERPQQIDPKKEEAPQSTDLK